MNRLIALFALVAVAFAEPEADSQFLYTAGYIPSIYAHHGAAHATAGMVQHPSGAVTPDDTASVKAAKVQHHAAKVNEYLKKPYMYAAPVVSTAAHVVKPVVGYTAPVATTGLTYTYPTTTYTHPIFKREAESDSAYVYNYSPYVSTYGAVAPAYYNAYNTGFYNTYAGYPYSTYHHGLYKREAESKPFYHSAYSYPYTTYGSYRYPAYSGVYSGYTGYTGYPYTGYTGLYY